MPKYKVKSQLVGGGFFGIGATNVSGMDFIEADSQEDAADKIYKQLRRQLIIKDMEEDYTISITDVEESN